MKRRASAGLFVVFSWGVVNLLTAFFGNLVLARLLDPTAFGIVAVGTTVMILSSAFAEGGLGNAFVRRPEQPTEAELRTLTGIQLALTGTAAVLIAGVALQFGTAGQVTAVMAFAVPIQVLQASGRVMLTRSLLFKQITLVDAVSIAGYYAFTIPAVLLGMGIWGLAVGASVRALIGVVAVAVIPRAGLRRPSLELVRVFPPIIAYGAKFQANWVVMVLRDQGLNAVVAAVGGFSALGLWALAGRLMLLPQVLLEAIGRITFPAMSHLLATKQDTRPLIERATRLVATACCLAFPVFAGPAPAIVPFLFGEKWTEAASIIPGACLALMVVGSVAAGGIGFLFADNRPGTVVLATGGGAVAALACAFVAIPLAGVAGVGVALSAGAFAEALVVAWVVRKDPGAEVLVPAILPVVVAAAATAAAWRVTTEFDSYVIGGVAGAVTALLISSVGLATLARGSLVDFIAVVVKSARDALGKPSPVAA